MLLFFLDIVKKGQMSKENIEKDIKDILSFPDEKFIEIIREVGFVCDRCGKCCTSEFNDHVFLLDEDAERIINIAGSEFLMPAPHYDVCDNLGKFYVMGYALKIKPGGNCIFYACGGCDYYDIRPAICKIFPYMLRREPDEDGNVEFRQIGGLNQHGLYYDEISDEKCKQIILSVKKYETDFLRQKLGFELEIKRYFKKNNLKSSRQMYDRSIREYEKGKKIEVYVFFKGRFVKELVRLSLHVHRPPAVKALEIPEVIHTSNGLR